jgi:1-deoxy-D-xylulose-5-phosphate synthase
MDPRVVIFGIGPMASTAIEVAEKIAAKGISCRAATATWVIPIPGGLSDEVRDADAVITIEDGLVEGGIGEAWANAANAAGNRAVWTHFGIPRAFLAHATRAQVVQSIGLEAGMIARSALKALAR